MRTESPMKVPRIMNPLWRIAILYSSFYPSEIAALVSSARQTLLKAGMPESNIAEQAVSGSWEIPLIGSGLLRAKRVDALIGLGIIVQGETHHAEIVAREAARGMMDVSLAHGAPFSCGILFVPSLKHAKERLHRGAETALAALATLESIGRNQ